MFRKLLLFLILQINAFCYAGKINSINFLYLTEPYGSIQREVFNIKIDKSGNCKVLPKEKEGKVIKVLFDNCSLLKPYRVGKRGNFIKSVELLPKGQERAEFLVTLFKKGALSLKENGNEVELKIEEADFVIPSLEFSKTVRGEVLNITVPSYHQIPNYRKSGKKLIFEFPGLKFKSLKKRLHSLSVSYLRTALEKDKSLLILSLNPNIRAIEVYPEKGRIVVEFKLKKRNARRKAFSEGGKIKFDSLKVSLHFTNANVRSVVKAIADVVGINVVFDPEVSGKVSVDFKKPVPWEDALRAVLDPLMLTYVKTPNYYRILPKSKVAKQEKVEPLKNYILKLNYVDAKSIERQVKTLIKRGSVVVNTQTNSLILKVTENDYKEVKKFLKAVDKPRKQVLVKAKIVQLSANAEKDLGFSWLIHSF